MKAFRKTIITLLAFAIATPLYGADTPQSLYLSAGKEERSGSREKAREIYESIISRFPESEFAVKANDRLLVITIPDRQAPSIKLKSEEKPSPGSTLFAPSPDKPLPEESKARSVAEASRMKEKAEVIIREELARLKRVDEARFGRKLNRIGYSERESEWRQTAERKVVEEFGMTIDEISAKLVAACKNAGLPAGCNESDFK